MREALRRTLPLAVCVMIQMVGHGMMSTYFGVMASGKGFDELSIGVLGGIYALGAIIAAALAAKIILRIGHIRMFALSTGVLTSSVILLGTWDNVFFWAVLRFSYGFAMTCTFVVGDSWFNHASKNEFRGKVMSIYMSATYAGVSFGQLSLYLLGEMEISVVLIAIGSIFSASSASILLTIQPAPPTSNPDVMPLKTLFARVPVSVVTVLLLGMLMTNFGTMMPVYLTTQNLSITTIALSMLSYQLGGFLGQYPMGYLSDKIDRRHVISFCFLVGLIGVSLVYSIFVLRYMDVGIGLWVAMFLIGCSVLPLYGVSSAHAYDRLEENEVIGAASTLVFMLSIGALLGPFTTGTMMDYWNADAFLYLVSAGLVIGFTYVIGRVIYRPMSDEDEKGSYSVMPRNVTPITQIVIQEDDSEQRVGE